MKSYSVMRQNHNQRMISTGAEDEKVRSSRRQIELREIARMLRSAGYAVELAYDQKRGRGGAD